MEQTDYLIDTNAIIDYLGNRMPASGMTFMNQVIDATPAVSVITKIETLSFTAPDPHYQILLDFMNDANIFALSDAIVDLSINIRKAYKIKLPDAIIAATALAYNLTLITRNTKDFDSIDGLALVNPFDL
jgi:predicted nucleic acid-binding protein